MLQRRQNDHASAHAASTSPAIPLTRSAGFGVLAWTAPGRPDGTAELQHPASRMALPAVATGVGSFPRDRQRTTVG